MKEPTFIVQALFLCLISISTCVNGQSVCGEGNWVPYKDEKCFLVIDNLVDAEDAATTCNSQVPFGSSSLLSIKTEEEQLFLTQQLYETSGVIDNVWVAARRYNASAFTWIEDNTTVLYSNWGPDFPSNDTEKNCVQMVSHLSRDQKKTAAGDGLWEDVSCLRRNLVVCQKLQTLSSAELQRIVLDNRKRVEENEKAVEETQRRVEDMENNPVPLGFIYTQLPSQPEPNAIWPKTQFSDVTSSYAGQFFRALGGESGAFGSTQDSNSPRLIVGYYDDPDAFVLSDQVVPYGGSWTQPTRTGAFVGPEGDEIGLRFRYEITETKPYNTAVKIWKRTA